VFLVAAGQENSGASDTPAYHPATHSRPGVSGQSTIIDEPYCDSASPLGARLRELFEPSCAEAGRAIPADRDQPSVRNDHQRLGLDHESPGDHAGRGRDPGILAGDRRATNGQPEDRLFQDYSLRIERIAAAAESALAAARDEYRAAMAEQDERLSLADCRQLAAIADMNFRLEQLADRQDRTDAANRQLAEEWRGELRRALEAERASWKADLARQEERLALLDQQSASRNRQISQAMARMIQPIVELQHALEGSPAAPDARSDAPLPEPEPSGSRPPESTPAAPDPESSPIRGHWDHPSRNPVTVGGGHLTPIGWAVSRAGIEDVQVFVDGQPRQSLTYGALRPDVAAAHPEFPDATHSGFIGTVSLEGLADGEHSLVVRVRGRDGRTLDMTRTLRVVTEAGSDPSELGAEYREWLAERSPSGSELARMRVEGRDLPYRPVISLVVPVYNTPEKYLSMMVDSILDQTYTRWELCLANGGSTAPHVRPFLNRLAEQDARVKVVHLPQNLGIAGHSNAALALATGEFIGLLDSDDVLMPYSLFEVVRALNDEPETDLIYSDEDKVDESGEVRWDPFFKPDWSPDLLLSVNYVSHFGVYRRSLVEAIGGFRPEYDGSQDYDLLLRFAERTDRIVHIPSVLYSWRVIPGSTAGGELAKPHAVDAAQRAIDDALRRRGVAGHAEPGYAPGRWRVRYDLRGHPAVTLVIPSGGKMKFLRPCLESVLERSTYPNLHVLVSDNSDGTEVADFCRDLGRRDSRLRYRRFRVEPFNYSLINNSAVSLVDTPYLVLLNDDITVIAPDWVEAMLEHAQRPEVGVVGAKLLFPDRSLQHVGVILGPHKNCGHAFKHFPEDHPGYFHLPRLIRNCSAVTFACAMMRRSVFDEVGGLDAENLAVAFNDVDICLRVRERGYNVVYTPYAVLVHHESVTKTVIANPNEVDFMHRRWAGVIRHDPFYNPNLTRKGEDYALNFDAPTVAERLGMESGSNGTFGAAHPSRFGEDRTHPIFAGRREGAAIRQSFERRI
jgi:GT2 family glycosyltransferase